MIRRVADAAVDLFLPAGCVSCRDWLPAGARARTDMLCARCRSRLREPSWPRCPRCHRPMGTGRTLVDGAAGCQDCSRWPDVLDAARSAWLLRTPADALVHGLKYEGWHELAPEMGRAIAGAASDLSVDGVVAVPTTPARRRTRGYDHGALLAAAVARRLDLPLVDALTRPSAAGSQTALGPDERFQNVRGAFRAGRAAAALRGRRVLLVDDVLTTGATACDAARALVDAGARTVSVATFARALPGAESGLA